MMGILCLFRTQMIFFNPSSLHVYFTRLVTWTNIKQPSTGLPLTNNRSPYCGSSDKLKNKVELLRKTNWHWRGDRSSIDRVYKTKITLVSLHPLSYLWRLSGNCAFLMDTGTSIGAAHDKNYWYGWGLLPREYLSNSSTLLLFYLPSQPTNY